MGNAQSSKSSTDAKFKLPGMIDSIAAKYILTQDFQDMTKLENKDYCNKLIVITSKIMAEHLSDTEIEYLSQRTKGGVVIDELAKDKIMYLEKESMGKLDVHDSVKKKRLCIGIAKFYIKILHVFSAIVATMNPVYSYKSELGKREKVSYMDKKLIPDYAKGNVTINKINLCSRRINSLMMKILDETETLQETPKESPVPQKQPQPPIVDASNAVVKPKEVDVVPPPVVPDAQPPIVDASNAVVKPKEPESTEVKPSQPTEKKALLDEAASVANELRAQIGGKPQKTIEIRPSFCNVNKKEDGSQMSLSDEPGIPELKQLYYDVFDYNTAKFTSMSKKSEEEYKKDLATFYKAFTGKSSVPSTVTSFSDIKLRDFSLHENCKPDGLFNKVYHGSFKNKLFSKYASQIKTMTENANKNREKLIDILNQLFRYVKDPESNNVKMITLHPSLTEKSLQKVVVESRKLIIQLYISCEQEYLGILETFEAIIETQVKKVTQQKIENLQKKEQSLLAEIS